MEKAVYVCRFAHKGDKFPHGTTSLLEQSSSLQEAYTEACPNSAKKFTAACWCHAKFHDFQACFGITGIKNQVSQSFQPSHDSQMFEFHSHISCM